MIAFNEKSTRAVEGGVNGGYVQGGVGQQRRAQQREPFTGVQSLDCSFSLLALIFFFLFNIKNVPNDRAETPRGFHCVSVCVCVAQRDRCLAV